MPRMKHTKREVEMLARLMKSEALGEGNFGMMLVGNVVVNRAVANCIPFKHLTSIKKVIMQTPGGFEGYNNKMYNGPINAKIKDMAQKTVDFWRAEPANHALYFMNPGYRTDPCRERFWGDLIDRYKKHCFYRADNTSECGI